MIYNLRIWAAGHGTGIEITESEYSALVAAMQRIYLAADVEEKLDLLLENYREYEQALLDLALQSSIFVAHDDHWVAEGRRLINRRVVNLLSAARLYIDQAKHTVCKFFAGKQGPGLKAWFSAEYDAHLEYRIGEALRNLALHRSLPVHIMSWPSSWEEIETDSKRLRFGVVPSLSLDELVAEGGFKALVLDQLKATGKSSFSLTLILRRYVESLTKVHTQVRASLSPCAESAHMVVAAARERALNELSPKLVSLVVSRSTDSLGVEEHHFVNERSWKRREFLIEKNSAFMKLSRRYVAAERPGDVA